MTSPVLFQRSLSLPCGQWVEADPGNGEDHRKANAVVWEMEGDGLAHRMTVRTYPRSPYPRVGSGCHSGNQQSLHEQLCSIHLLGSSRAHHGLVSLPTRCWDFLPFLQLVEISSGFYLFICGFGDRVMSGGIIDDLSQTKPKFLCFPEPFIILSAVAISFWSQAGQDNPRVRGLGSSP